MSDVMIELLESLEEIRSRNLSRFYFVNRSLRAYEEAETILIDLTGCDIEKLVELFAAGYTLQPPKEPNPLSMSELFKE